MRMVNSLHADRPIIIDIIGTNNNLKCISFGTFKLFFKYQKTSAFTFFEQMKMPMHLQLNSLKFLQSQENPAVHWRRYLKRPLRKKRVSWHWCTCRRSSNTSPYDFSCFADCVWRCHTPGMDWICSLPSQDLRCSNQHTRCSDIYNCIILQGPAYDVTTGSFIFAHACVSWICQQDKLTHMCVFNWFIIWGISFMLNKGAE